MYVGRYVLKHVPTHVHTVSRHTNFRKLTTDTFGSFFKGV
jgi:hypothetical protein